MTNPDIEYPPGVLGQCGWVDNPFTGEGICPDPATRMRVRDYPNDSTRDPCQCGFCQSHADRHDAGERPDLELQPPYPLDILSRDQVD